MWKYYCPGSSVHTDTFVLAVQLYLEDDLEVEEARVTRLFSEDNKFALGAAADRNRDGQVCVHLLPRNQDDGMEGRELSCVNEAHMLVWSPRLRWRRWLDCSLQTFTSSCRWSVQ
jgi:hypothetical protein